MDAEAERVHFPPGLVKDFIDAVRAEASPAPPAARFSPSADPGFGTQIAQIYCDAATGQRRSANREDLITCLNPSAA